VIDQRFPNIKGTEPEMLAHHLTEAGLIEAAIPLWQTAGSLALKRLSLNEAITHLNKGLELVAVLPSSTERDARELDLRSLLGAAWTALGGWYVHEVWDSLHPALKLARTLRRSDALLSILFGHWANVLTRGRLAESLHWVTRIYEAAEEYRDHDLRILTPYTAQVSHFLLGKFVEAREHGDQLLANYTEERFGHVVDVIHQDPKTVALCYNTHSTWMLGYPEQAMKISDATDAHARRRGHPFDLGFWFTIGALIFDYLGDPQELLKRTEEAERLGHENSLPVLTRVLVPIHSAIALIRRGRFAEGTASLEGGLAALEEGGGRVMFPCWKSALAEGMAQLGDLESALHLIDEIIAQVERPGWEERSYYAETLRLKGWMLSLRGDVANSEHNFLASLDWARRQQAKSWELRTAMSLTRLWQSQGKRQEAYELLAPVYGWFTEGFDTKDLQEAKVLLAELR
jgi:predicted ATPase